MHDRFLKACRCEPVDRVPIWLMRQAGRFMAEYRAIRSQHDLLTMIRTPELAAEVTLQPIRAFGMDAAIIFADILPLLETLGLKLRFVSGRGPVIDNPVQTPEAVDQLHRLPVQESLQGTFEAIRLVRRELEGKAPLIGFSGAPFTLACYAIEGSTSRDYHLARQFMYQEPRAWHALMDRLTDAVIAYLQAQQQAGAQALQLFDSWAGLLSPEAYRAYVLPHMQTIFASLSGVPVIHFATGNPALIPLLQEAGGDVIGLDWRCSIQETLPRIQAGRALQGNLDPEILLTSPEVIRREAQNLLRAVGERPGFIFNLGHGVLKQTPEAHVRVLIETVQQHGVVPTP